MGHLAFETGHIGLNVTDLERSRKFYTEIFGFEILRESSTGEKQFAFLGHEGKPVLTLWKQSQGTFPRQSPGLHHLSFQADSIEQVKEAEIRLRRWKTNFQYDGVVPHAEGAQSGGLFFEDPDGIRLEIFAAEGAGCNPAPVHDGPTCGFF
ncbi:MAG: VOC family protein [Acidobacteriia bacterium]|nr:VOC family protein [Terriglobia bacterium]